MNRNGRLLAFAAISAALAGPVVAQSISAPASPPRLEPVKPDNADTIGAQAKPTPVKPDNADTIGTTRVSAATTATGAVMTPIDPMKIDQVLLRQGMRTSKVVGMTVVNSTGETLGTVDDLIVMPNDTVTYAVLSVGGFLGMGAHYIVVPYSSLEAVNKQMRLPGASKESLKALPSYSYPA